MQSIKFQIVPYQTVIATKYTFYIVAKCSNIYVEKATTK